SPDFGVLALVTWRAQGGEGLSTARTVITYSVCHRLIRGCCLVHGPCSYSVKCEALTLHSSGSSKLNSPHDHRASSSNPSRPRIAQSHPAPALPNLKFTHNGGRRRGA